MLPAKTAPTVVQVDHEDGHAVPVAPGPGDLFVEPVVEVAVVAEVRQPIRDGLLLDQPVQASIGQSGGRLVGDALGKGQFFLRAAPLLVRLHQD